MRYVLDCSVAVRWVVPQTHSAPARTMLDRLLAGTMDLSAPAVIVAELGHVLRKLVVGERLPPEKAIRFLDRFLNIRIDIVPDPVLAHDALELALRHTGTFYDSLYVSLAQRDDLSVVTADESMIGAFEPLGRVVHLAEIES